MKTIIFLVLGTLIGAGSLGVVSGLRLKEEILTERLHAEEDSLAALALASSEAALADSSQAGVPPDSASIEDTSGQDAGGEVEPAPGPGQEDPVTAPRVVEDPVVEDPVVGDVRPTPATDPGSEALEEEARQLASETAERLSKIFSQMKPADAAEVLSYLTDAEIERILLGIRERDAAAILSQLEPSRAAAVSRRVLRPGGSDL